MFDKFVEQTIPETYIKLNYNVDDDTYEEEDIDDINLDEILESEESEESEE